MDSAPPARLIPSGNQWFSPGHGLLVRSVPRSACGRGGACAINGEKVMIIDIPRYISSTTPGRIRNVMLRSIGEGVHESQLRTYFELESLTPLDHLNYCFGDVCSRESVPHSRRARFNHLLRWDMSAFTSEVEDLITVLSEALCLPTSGDLDLALTLDWMETQERDHTGTSEWVSTTIGDLVHRAKSDAVGPRTRELSIDHLAERLAAVIHDHPAYRECSFIVSPPGSLGGGRGLGQILAERVAAATGKRLAKTYFPRYTDPLASGELIDVELPLDGECLIIDDVWDTGSTVAVVARRARRAGASRVHALVATRMPRTSI